MIPPELLLQGYRLGIFPMAMEDDSFWRQFRDFFRRNVELDDLRVDLAFPHPAGDHLGVLRAKIENENFRMGGCDSFHGGGG